MTTSNDLTPEQKIDEILFFQSEPMSGNMLADWQIKQTKSKLLALKSKWEAEAVRKDRLANARFYKDKIDKMFDEEISTYNQLTNGDK